MTEFDCQSCGIHVVQIVGEPHTENIYCAECRFIEGLDSPAARRAMRGYLGHPDAPEDDEP